jgi:predicted nucleotidyltransferase component of viral defense system
MNREKEKQIIRSMKALAQRDSCFNINEIRVIIAIERAIARLLVSTDLAEHIVFKGGFVLLKSYESARFTRDADALAVAISKVNLSTLVRTALSVDLDDGFWFGDIQVQELTEQGEYGAYRFDCAFQVGEPDPKKLHKLSRIHIDVGFSDRLSSKPESQVMPSLLEHEDPVTWKIYSIEDIVAEKLQTLFHRGSANSRAKDVYDLVYLFPRANDRKILMMAIKRTFINRGTVMPESFVKQASEIDKTILSCGWAGVKILQDKSDFESTWRALLHHLKTLDEDCTIAR